jgi:hypothetical protein
VQGFPLEVAGGQCRIGEIKNAKLIGVQFLTELTNGGHFTLKSIEPWDYFSGLCPPSVQRPERCSPHKTG